MILGVDIGGTNVKFGVFDFEFNMIESSAYQLTQFDAVKIFFTKLLERINYYINEYSISSVGIGIPGLINNNLILEVSPNLKFLEGTSFKNELSEKIPLPIIIDNDANMAAMSEYINPEHGTPSDFIYITIGTGIGGAIIVNNNIYRGTLGFSGEIGHMIISSEYDEDSNDYRKGTLELYAGKTGIVELYNKITGNKDSISVEDINLMSEKGDVNARKTFDITAFHISSAIVSIINLLSIPNFVIGGGISKSDYLLQKIEKFTKQRTFLNDYDKINIKAAKFSANAGIFGAAYLAKYYFQQLKD